MSREQISILVILAVTVVLFLWGRWRHDMVAMAALLACTVAGVVKGSEAFQGFGHPAVVTVAAVLILSRSLQTSGAVDYMTRRLIPSGAGPTVTIGVLASLGALLSAFMNNVGALALLMPVAIQVAAKQKFPPGRVLMPLAFGSILGGMTTLIGTPPNLIVSGFREQAGDKGFAMFDFTPVGLAVAGAGLLFTALVGWRLVPVRERAGAEGFETGAYITEARVGAGGATDGKSLREIGPLLEAADAQVIGMVRNRFRVPIPSPHHVMRDGDVLVIEAEPGALAGVLGALGLVLEEDPRNHDELPDGEAVREVAPAPPDAGDISLMELTVQPGTAAVGRSATDIHLRSRYGINLLALSRRGKRSIRRLRSEPIQAGDVLLMQGRPDAILNFASEFGCIPLAGREIRIPEARQAVLSTVVMALAVCGAAFGLLPAAISFVGGVMAGMVLRIIPLRSVYDAVDWPVVVLLGALIPVAGAMETTGAADVIAKGLLAAVAGGNPMVALGLLLVVTMTLSDFMNNAATAAVMCPIAIRSAAQLSVSSDPFLIAVAVGASCAFLTPIGHQNNTLILGPGGLRFGDYWRLGLPLEILVVVICVPLIPWVWPF